MPLVKHGGVSSWDDLTDKPSDFTPSAHALDAHTAVTLAELNAKISDKDIASTDAATTSAAGLMSAADKVRLDAMADSANNYAHPNHSGDVTSVADGATTIANDAVTNVKLANMATQTVKGRNTADTGDPEDLDMSTLKTMLDATTTPTASSIPIADSGGKIADGWIPAKVARLASPTFTGTPTAPTAPSGTSTEQIATTKFVKTAVDVGIASNDAMALRGTLGTGGTAASLPTEGYLVGWTYKVVSSGTYAGQACSIGDLMICVSSFNTAYKDADWSRVPISDEYSDYYLLEGDPA